MINIRRSMCGNALQKVERLHVLLFQGESEAHRFTIKPSSGINFTGSEITARFVRFDGVRVDLTGSVTEDGEATVLLGAACYAVPGEYTLTIFSAQGSAKVAIYAFTGEVKGTQGNGSVINSTGNNGEVGEVVEEEVSP